MDLGYIQISRKLMNHDIWQKDSDYLKLFIGLLLMAYWKDTQKVKKGCLYIKKTEIANILKVKKGKGFTYPSNAKINRILEYLSTYKDETKPEDTSLIKFNVKEDYVYIYINNYSKYQEKEKKYEYKRDSRNNRVNEHLQKYPKVGDKHDNIGSKYYSEKYKEIERE